MKKELEHKLQNLEKERNEMYMFLKNEKEGSYEWKWIHKYIDKIDMEISLLHNYQKTTALN